MKTINRYIFAEAILYFFIALLALTGTILTVRVLKLTSLIINKGVELGQVLKIVVAIVPTFLELALPMAAMFGIMFAFARLSGDSEIIVIRANGISILQLIKPVLFYAIFVFMLALFISLRLRAWSYSTLSNVIFDIAKSKTTAALESGVFNELGKVTLYSEELDNKSGDLKNVLIDDRREEGVRKIITAKSGRIISSIENRRVEFLLYDGIIHEENQERYFITDFKTNQIAINPNELFSTDNVKGEKRDRELSNIIIKKQLAEYKYNSNLTNEEARKIRGLKVEYKRRFSMPWAALILALIGMPLGIQSPRSQKTWGFAISLFLGLAIFLLYFGILSVGLAFAESGKMSVNWSLWLPNLMLTCLALLFISKMQTESWQSVGEVISSRLNYITKLFNRFIQ